MYLYDNLGFESDLSPPSQHMLKEAIVQASF